MTDAPQGAALTAAHTETVTLRIDVSYPAHEPRRDDPSYHYFHAAHDRLKKLGRLVCWIGNADCGGGPVELHHFAVEFSMIADVDHAKFAAAYGLHLTSDEDFLAYVEGENGLLALCPYHHRGHGGIHVLPHPWWVVQKYLAAGVVAPAHVIEEGKPS